jgi:excisionase family DNA binding protein
MQPIQSIPFDPVLGQREVARVMGVSVDTVRRRCAAGDLTVIRLSPRRVGVRASEVERYLRAREGLSPATPIAPDTDADAGVRGGAVERRAHGAAPTTTRQGKSEE